jgi:hypothetical protein
VLQSRIQVEQIETRLTENPKAAAGDVMAQQPVDAGIGMPRV